MNIIGQSFGRYHILEQLGEGGMATVYRAYDTRLDADVAVKVIRRSAFAPDQLEQVLKRFEREAKSLAKLSHANIVGVIDYGDYEGSPYLVMEYLPGGTLKQKMGQPMPCRDAARILLPIARALDYAHRKGMAHRDVKPSNILITADGDPMLTDFGIAKILEAQEGFTLTGTGVGIGTPEYMSPEQWTGQAGPSSDIYSLGVVFYEMLTGRKPYEADTPAAVLLKQASDPLPNPRNYVADLPYQAEHVLLKALAKKPEDRFATMADFAVALDNLASEPTIAGLSSSAAVILTGAESLAVPEPEKTTDLKTMAAVGGRSSSRRDRDRCSGSREKAKTNLERRRKPPPGKGPQRWWLWAVVGVVADRADCDWRNGSSPWDYHAIRQSNDRTDIDCEKAGYSQADFCDNRSRSHHSGLSQTGSFLCRIGHRRWHGRRQRLQSICVGGSPVGEGKGIGTNCPIH